MSAALPLCEDFDADALRRLARASRAAGQSRRLLALASIYDGGSRTDAARIGAVGLQTVRDWVVAFNAQGPAGLIDRPAPAPRPSWTRRSGGLWHEPSRKGPTRTGTGWCAGG